MLRAVAILLMLASTARAECPESDAACVLQKEGAEALAAKDYPKARAKFDASLATTPSARGYLGLATADEALNDVAAAYENVVDAKRMSDAELVDKPADADIKARAERIKYLIGDLRARVGLVYLRLPGNIPAFRLVSVQRKSEGNVPDPLRRPIAVAPDQQALIIVLDDGNKVEMDVEVPAGRDATYVVPAERFALRYGPPPPPLPLPPKPELLKTYSIGIEASLIDGKFQNGGAGYGLFASGGYRLNPRLMLTARVGYIGHGTNDDFTVTGDPSVTAFELPLFVGGRYHFADHFYIFAEVGYILFDREVGPPMATVTGTGEDQLFGVAAASAGVGVHTGRFELDVNALWGDGGPEDDARAMLTARVRLSP